MDIWYIPIFILSIAEGDQVNHTRDVTGAGLYCISVTTYLTYSRIAERQEQLLNIKQCIQTFTQLGLRTPG